MRPIGGRRKGQRGRATAGKSVVFFLKSQFLYFLMFTEFFKRNFKYFKLSIIIYFFKVIKNHRIF